MTSKSSESAKFIDLHGHHTPTERQQEQQLDEVLTIYSYSPQINNLPPKGQWFCAGVHPWKLSNAQQDFQEITELVKSKYCLMVGEAGLDRSIQTDLALQEEVFRRHIELAMEVSMPLIIHNVRSLSDIFRLHKSYSQHTAWVLHDFNGSIEDLRNCHKRGIYTSLGARFFESKSAKISQTILNNTIELEYIFFETDDRTDLSISYIYKRFAEIQNIDVNDLKEKIWNNLALLLGKDLTRP